MSKCNFSIEFNDQPVKLIGIAEKAIVGEGGVFDGNPASGIFEIKTFFGQVEGSYNISGQTLNVNITDKPMLVPCIEIENQLKKFLKISS